MYVAIDESGKYGFTFTIDDFGFFADVHLDFSVRAHADYFPIFNGNCLSPALPRRQRYDVRV
jgi:hypothetical protein